MKKYMVLYYAPVEFMKDAQTKSPEEMQKGMKAWMDWADACGDGMVELGAPLGNGKKITETEVAVSTKNVVGYSILQAEDVDAVSKLLQDHPHLKWGATCEIEFYEMMAVPK